MRSTTRNSTNAHGGEIYGEWVKDRRLEFKDAKAQAAGVDRRLRELVRTLFPVGARVRWSHGKNIRSELVAGVSGRRFDMLMFSVRSDASGRLCWIHAGRILSFAGL